MGLYISNTGNVIVSNFTFRNITEDEVESYTPRNPVGIYVNNSNNIQLLGNTFQDNMEGVPF